MREEGDGGLESEGGRKGKKEKREKKRERGESCINPKTKMGSAKQQQKRSNSSSSSMRAMAGWREILLNAHCLHSLHRLHTPGQRGKQSKRQPGVLFSIQNPWGVRRDGRGPFSGRGKGGVDREHKGMDRCSLSLSSTYCTVDDERVPSTVTAAVTVAAALEQVPSIGT